MVSVRKAHQTAEFSVAEWLAGVPLPNERQQLKFAETYHLLVKIVEQSGHDGGQELLRQGREMVEILLTLHMDLDTLLAAMIEPLVHGGLIDEDVLHGNFGADICSLIENIEKMDAISTLHSQSMDASAAQVDNLRRMLLAMAEDVRAVVIKLASQVCYLRSVKNSDEDTRVMVARQTTNIYAPLANRLGIGQLKWELEDYAFRYLHPNTYKQIASQLNEKRLDRERYITEFVSSLQTALERQGIEGEVQGRPKHIYSIWKKMQNKKLSFEQLFDVRAVRVLVDKLQDCYGALGVVHTSWQHIHREFDDYVATPKPNGYRSIHTVVVGPEGKTVEIQIRTHQMHEDSELGVAAHWKYKEGESSGRSGFEDKIAWLRKILAWQEDVAESGNLVDDLRSQVFEDRVYVFTPNGDVVDLPQGSTPLDFAYYVHSQVGNTCIGAKVGGRIVPFTYHLQTGDRVEILTAKNGKPSRDWLNPNMGYVNSSRARAKVQHWFKLQDRDQNLAAGKELLETELNKVNIDLSHLDKALKRFNLNKIEELQVAVGAGDIRINQVLNYLQSLLHKPTDEELTERLLKRQVAPNKKPNKDAVLVDGVGNLMTNIARCCQPVPGDSIVGYITQGRGISIHRDDCDQFQDLLEAHPERQIEVRWGENYSGGYSITLRVVAADRSGLLRDITTLLANEKINVMEVKSRSNTTDQTAVIDMDVEIYNIDILSRMLSRIGQLDGIIEARRL
ncbi:GTP diphosphokinase [Echinimonas agarilytica]|uniref:GTP pyrophosphokinase n=1 Tax=Echinimonas agarilytica TaxID=1215918 RepID=A0AA41W4K1_9GAMM|nr:GTP diphosphokinase [Echinimonas agarilytica]MCM2678829.1 GTP diphosphokinase [Echinimonas agarilytica]